MKKLSACLMFVGLLALAACGGGAGGSGSGGNGGGGGGSGKMDMTDSTIDMYKNGTIKAMYWVQVHADPQAGQYWETTMEAFGSVNTNRWQVAAVDGNHAVVENLVAMESDFAESAYVIAYKVDLSKGDMEPNVVAAWIGKPGEAGAEIEIMEVPEPTDGGEAGDPPHTESFSGVEAAGMEWSGTVYSTEHAKWWQADNAWFSGQIRMEAGDMVTELTAIGDDADPLLDWE
jgi:uncharacterized protein YrzB (UPF0473 family)